MAKRFIIGAVSASLAMAALIATSTTASAAPTNDNISGAIDLLGTSTSGTNASASMQSNEYTGATANDWEMSVWYKWSAPSTISGQTFTMCSTNFKGAIAIYGASAFTGSPPNAFANPTVSPLASAESNAANCSGGLASISSWTPVASTDYWIQISKRTGGGTGSAGSFDITYPTPAGGASPSPSPSPSSYTETDKVTICHRTHATTNPYRLITVSTASVINESGAPATNGHAWHNPDKRRVEQGQLGGLFDTTKTYKPNEKFWGDIIPPFKDRTSGRTYDGLNWYWGNPTATLKPGSLGYWITDADFIAATASGATTAQQDAVAMCTGVKGAEVADVTKYYDKEVKDGGQKPKDVEDDIIEQGALDPEGRSLDPDPKTAWPTVTTDPTNVFDWTSCTFYGTLATGTTWTAWKFEYGTSDTLETFDSTTETKEAAGGQKSTKVSGLSSGTTYYYRIVGKADVAGSGGTTSETTLYGEIKSCTTRSSSLGAWQGNIWLDLKLNDTKDSIEPWIAGITVTLTFPDGTSKTTTTDANGFYHFEDLPAGSYTVTASLPKSTGLQKSWNTGGGATWSATKSVKAGETTIVDFAAVGGVTLTGPILIDGTNRQATDCMVEVTWAGVDGVLDTADDVVYETECKPDGTYEAKGVGFGPTRVVARTPSGVYGTVQIKTITKYGVYTQPLNVPTAPLSVKKTDSLGKKTTIAGVISPKGSTRMVFSKPRLASGRTADVTFTCAKHIASLLPTGDVPAGDDIACKYATVSKHGQIVLKKNAPSNLKYTLTLSAPKTKKLAAYSFTKEYRKPA